MSRVLHVQIALAIVSLVFSLAAIVLTLVAK